MYICRKVKYMIIASPIKEMNTIQKTDVKYREIDALNSSMLKLFDNDPIKFFEQYKLGRTMESKKTYSLTIGDIVDFYILECNGDEEIFESRWHERFALSSEKLGTSQVLELARILYSITLAYTSTETSEVMVSFETRFEEAFNAIQRAGFYKGKKKSQALEDFNTNGLVYFNELLENTGKSVVDERTLEKGKRVAKLILTDAFTARAFDVSNDATEIFTKFPIEWTYKLLNGKVFKCKSEIDHLSIDHANKEIHISDLKTTHDNENFSYAYIKYAYYIQAGFYYLAVSEWAKSEDMGEYTIHPPRFIVGDTSINNRRPITYEMTATDLNKALEGFSLGITSYKGVRQIVEDIAWAEDNDIWNCSREVYENEGKGKINIKYE